MARTVGASAGGGTPPQAPPPSPAHATSSSFWSGSSGGDGCCMGSCACKELFTWKNPVTSSAVFVGINLMYFFVFALGKSFLSLLCYFFLVPFGVGLLFRLLDLAPSSGGGSSSKLLSSSSSSSSSSFSYAGNVSSREMAMPMEIVSRETIEKCIQRTYECINTFLSSFRDIILWRDPILSLKCMALTWAAGYCASFVSLSFLLFFALWIAFGFSFLKKMIYDTFFVPIVKPHITQGRRKVHQLVNAIPKMDDVTK